MPPSLDTQIPTSTSPVIKHTSVEQFITPTSTPKKSKPNQAPKSTPPITSSPVPTNTPFSPRKSDTPPGSPSKPSPGSQLIGKKIKVLWGPKDTSKPGWYTGTVRATANNNDLHKGSHEIDYDDSIGKPPILEHLTGENPVTWEELNNNNNT